MNAGAIAFDSSILFDYESGFLPELFTWLEKNIQNQVMYTNNAEVTYIIGESDLFNEPSFNGKYSVYHLLATNFSNTDKPDYLFTVYQTVSSICV
jgi:hypothetical protein